VRGLGPVAARAAEDGLAPLGAFHPGPGDGAPEGCRTLVLIGPDGAAFWERFRASAEIADRRPDPLDRWTRRVVGRLAADLGAGALYPFGGPPFAPFTAWARRSGEAWDSPVGLLVHARLGLFVSFRAALALPRRLELPATPEMPCAACSRPCLDACPAAAMTGAGYDVAACRRWLDAPAGRDCRDRGCAVRRACPVGAGLRPEAQSAFHMAAFRGTEGRCDG
jgi:hypothetical protein